MVAHARYSEKKCDDVKDLFKVYGTVDKCHVKLHQNGNLHAHAIIGMKDLLPKSERKSKRSTRVKYILKKTCNVCPNFDQMRAFFKRKI